MQSIAPYVCRRLRIACTTRLLLLLLALPAAVHAQFTCTTNNGTITITGYTGPGGAVTIPDTINGLPITSIGAWAFSFCTNLTGITIPDSVANIGGDAFLYCTRLTRVTIPTNVVSINVAAFYFCTSLTNITIPNGATSIGNFAFYCCTNLTGILIPNSVSSIGDWAFAYCSGLTGVAIPNSVTRMGDGAFAGCASLTGITIPNSATSIGDNAFFVCTRLTGITISNSVTSIGDNAFFECTSLTSITIPNSVTNIGSYAFFACTSLTNVTIPNSITSIGDNAFYFCARLTAITIPNNVTSIGDEAFYNCASLTSLSIGSGVNHIGDAAFYYCTSLGAITVNPLNSYYSSVDGILFDKSQTVLIQCPWGRTGNYIIPDSVTSIGDFAFYFCPNLTGVTIGNSVINIGDGAFSGCGALTNVAIGNGVTTIGNDAFSFCPGLASITIPGNVITVEDEAFSGCGSLTNITIGNGVTTIGNDAFSFCPGLTTITIPDSVTSIGDGVFAGCTSLTAITVAALNSSYSSVDGVLFDESQTTLIECPMGKAGDYTIPNSVTTIGGYAFDNCSLTSITIPNSVTNIGDNAFAESSSLAGIYFQGDAPGVGSDVFADDDDATVYYSPGTKGWNPQIQTGDASFGVRTNQFGFKITGSSGLGIVVEACTDLANPFWCPVETITFTCGSFYFSDPQWTNYRARFYRLRDLTFGGCPAVLWNPPAQPSSASLGVRANDFGFTITGVSNLIIVVEACTNLANPIWSPVGTNTLTGGSFYFSDPEWRNYPARFYRLLSP